MMFGAPLPQSETRTKLTSRGRTLCVTFAQDSVWFETTAYKGWDWFRPILNASLETIESLAPVQGYTRLGLRYVNELRVPLTGDLPDWSQWVIPELIGPARRFGGLVDGQLMHQGLAQFRSGADRLITVRYGSLTGRSSVSPDGQALVAPTTFPEGPFFLWDTDCAWTLPVTQSVPTFEATSVGEQLESLHSPVKGLFEAVITDRLRAEVLM